MAPLSLPGPLVGPYRVLEKIGAGGMGEVFLAEDTRLRRQVALKRLASDALGDMRRALLREARAVAQLHHPGIASIFDVIEDDQTVWIVMEYVEGESLSARLRRGPLPVAEVLALGQQLTDALADAHGRGIVHCDLKPANIRVTPAGRAKILDFGLAQRSPEASATDDTQLVSREIGHRESAGLSGTAGYLAPERLSGTPADVRGDIYAMGVILFELLTGRRPFEGTNLLSTAVMALTTPTPSPSAIDPAIPEEVSRLVLKALAREPDARFQSAAALGDALHAAGSGATPATANARTRPRPALVAMAGLVAAAGLAGVLLLLPGWRAPLSASSPSIVVKPFTNLSGDAANDHLGSGITDDLITKLSLLPRVTVVSRETTAAYLAATPSSPTLARDLGASYVVGGGVERAGDQLHVTVQLVSSTGATVWMRSFDGTVAGFFTLQQQLAEGLAEGLDLPLSTPERERLTAVPTRNVEAFADYSQGRLFLDRRDVKGNVLHAADAFTRALAKDSSFALAHAGLGMAYWQRFIETNETAWTLRAIDASLEALRLSPAQAEVHLTLATIYKGIGRTPAAVDEIRTALALQPNADEAHRLLGDILAGQGQIDEAVQAYHQAIAIRPNYWQNHNRLAVALLSVGRYAEAESSCRRVTELQPDSHIGHNNLGAVAMMQGDLTLALGSFSRAAEIRPGASTFSNIGTIHFWNGRFADARAAYARAIALRAGDASLHRNLGDALAALGDAAGARKAYLQALDFATEQLTVNPKDPAHLSLVALVEAKLGRTADARLHVDQAVALAPKGKDVFHRSAAVAALAGDRARALADLTTAVQLGYSPEQARRDLDLRPLHALPEYQSLVGTRKP